ncbi:hypothetical protein [Dactylosporangium sp. CS-033363]|uniref:hypothetical protein n=1 Tax=Dactylosporangium sp. CS-033363 TaxID=3239935 RepID=UPI003D8F9D81
MNPGPSTLINPAATAAVLAEVAAERAAQDARWGQQDHVLGIGPDRQTAERTFAELAATWKRRCQLVARDGAPEWAFIALEEVGEFLECTDPARARAEALQAAAVFTAIVEAIDRQVAGGVLVAQADERLYLDDRT